MITKYKISSRKITMDLLSFMLRERELKTLQQTLQRYEENSEWYLLLWKESEAIVRLIGIEMGENHFIIHHIAVTLPSRGEGIGHAMIEKVQQLMNSRETSVTEETKAVHIHFAKEG